MGWGWTLLLGDIGNRMDIADSEEEIRRIKRGLSGSFSRDQSQDARLESLAQENALTPRPRSNQFNTVFDKAYMSVSFALCL